MTGKSDEVVQVQGGGVNEPLTPEGIAQSSIVQAVGMIITQAVRDRASDIHIEPQEDRVRVRYRIDGILHEAVALPLGIHAALLSRIKEMAKDGQFSTTVADRSVEFRVAFNETIWGKEASIHILDKAVSLLKLTDVGFSLQLLEQCRHNILNSPFGMILVSGLTGSGKTTTLYALLRELEAKTRKNRKIGTIEGQVDYRFGGNIQQTQVQANKTFAQGVRKLVHMGHDVIMVGDIPDRETAEVALQAASSGHLVLSSIRADGAVSALDRLTNLGGEPFLVTSAVIAVLSQRLVRKVCPYCRSIGSATPAEAIAYQQELQEAKTDFCYGQGCNFCSRTGFLGRTAVIEMMVMSDEIRRLVSRRASSAKIRAQALREGMVTMCRDGMLKARDGVTTPSEIIRNVYAI